MGKISESEFYERCSNLPEELETKSQGKKYRNVCVKEKNVCGVKESGNSFNISISKLYEAYKNDDFHTTSELLKYKIGRNSAPAKAIIDYVLGEQASSTETLSEKLKISPAFF